MEENGPESGENPLVSSSLGGPGEGREESGEGVGSRPGVVVGAGLAFADNGLGDRLSSVALSPAGDRAEIGVLLPDSVFGLMELLKPPKAVALGRAEKMASDHAIDSCFPASAPMLRPLFRSPRPSERDIRGTELRDIRGAFSIDNGVAVLGVVAEGTESDVGRGDEGIRLVSTATDALVGVTLFSPLIGRRASREGAGILCSNEALLGGGGGDGDFAVRRR